MKASKAGQLLGEFSLLYKENFPDYKTARERERSLKSGQGRQWLDEFESVSPRPADVYAPLEHG
jgi:hypothetical protein